MTTSTVQQRPDLQNLHTPVDFANTSLNELEEKITSCHSKINKLQNQYDLFEYIFTKENLPGWEKVYTCSEGVIKSLDPLITLDSFGKRIQKDSRSWGSTANARAALITANQIIDSKREWIAADIKYLTNEHAELTEKHDRLRTHLKRKQIEEEKRQIEEPKKPVEEENKCITFLKKVGRWISAPFIFLFNVITYPLRFLRSLA